MFQGVLLAGKDSQVAQKSQEIRLKPVLSLPQTANNNFLAHLPAPSSLSWDSLSRDVPLRVCQERSHAFSLTDR